MITQTNNYFATRTGDGDPIVRCVRGDGSKAGLWPRLDLFNHSPAGFEWGYGGSGPAQLALAILADALGDDKRAVRLHQQFKWRVVAKLPRDGFVLSRDQVLAAAQQIEAEREQRAHD